MNTLKIIIGCLLVAAPFIAFAAYIAKEDGWKVMLEVFGMTLLIIIVFGLGTALIMGGI